MEIRGIWATRQVFVGDKELSPKASQKVYNHSPDGFNWGYGGSGPAQLALALLLLYLPQEKALEHYQKFKWDVIARLPHDDFSISDFEEGEQVEVVGIWGGRFHIKRGNKRATHIPRTYGRNCTEG